MLIVTLQAPNASLFADDLPAFLGFVDGLQFRAPPKAVTPPPKTP